MSTSDVGIPLITLNGMSTSPGVHKLSVKSNDGFDLIFLEPIQKAIDVHEVAIDALEMNNVRFLIFYNSDQFVCGEEASSIHNSRKIGEEMIDMGVKFAAGLINVRLIYFLTAAVANNGIYTFGFQAFVDVRGYLSRASEFIYAVDL